MMEQERKSFFKHWTGIAVLVVVALAVVWGLVRLPQIVNVIQGKLTAFQNQRTLKSLEAAYKNDKYGGKTPEETYDLFIEALKKDDIELASKYFVTYKQDDWLKTLGEYKKEKIIISFIAELENTKKIWKRSNKSTDTTVSFTYKVLVEKDGAATFEGQEINIPAGNYTNESVFSKYPTGVWKIEGL